MESLVLVLYLQYLLAKCVVHKYYHDLMLILESYQLVNILKNVFVGQRVCEIFQFVLVLILV